MPSVNAVCGAIATPLSMLKVVCGVRLQYPGVPGGQLAEDRPLPYSPSTENQPSRSSLRSRPVATL
ncbi:MAG TPA: hypothetical protein VKT51_10320 [Candidatus Eremiobacteraceae bacterium]|nr:hypothetical protein [Candidatus Eremiobacteraceae bacterium]